MSPSFVQPGSRDSTLIVHDAVREAILTGELAAGSWLSQVKLARDFGVSRGPVREALRLLEREGLIETAVNQRCRIASVSVDDLEQLYAIRIVNEALAISVTVPRLGAGEIAQIKSYLDDLDRMAGKDVSAWQVVHRDFHAALVQHAGERTRRLLEECWDHSERYRRAYIAGDPRAWSVGAAEHRQIVSAVTARDAAGAAGLLARHLARTALGWLATMAPEHDPTIIRTALRGVLEPSEGVPISVRPVGTSRA